MANNFPNFIENYKPTDLRISMCYKHEKHEEKYTKIYNNQTAPIPVIKRNFLCQKRHIMQKEQRKNDNGPFIRKNTS